MKNSELKCNIEVEGVTLTKPAIQYLKALQDRNNEDIKSMRDILADVVCFLAKKILEFNPHLLQVHGFGGKIPMHYP